MGCHSNILDTTSLYALSRETGRLVAVLSGWRDEFLEGEVAALKRRIDDPEVAVLEQKLKRARLLNRVG